MDKTLKVTVGTKLFWTQVLIEAHNDALSYVLDGYDPDSSFNGPEVDWSRHHFLAYRFVGLVGPQIRDKRLDAADATVSITLLPNAQEYLKNALPLMEVTTWSDRYFFYDERATTTELKRVLV